MPSARDIRTFCFADGIKFLRVFDDRIEFFDSTLHRIWLQPDDLKLLKSVYSEDPTKVASALGLPDPEQSLDALLAALVHVSGDDAERKLLTAYALLRGSSADSSTSPLATPSPDGEKLTTSAAPASEPSATSEAPYSAVEPPTASASKDSA